MALPGPGELKPCNCKNSRCLKLYCICFDAGAFCDANLCHCKNCANTPSNTDEVMQARVHILAKNPTAFQPKVVARGDGEAAAAPKGCNCRKTRCIKKYCDCFSVGVPCQPSICSCVGCENMPGSAPPGVPTAWAGADPSHLAEYAAAHQFQAIHQGVASTAQGAARGAALGQDDMANQAVYMGVGAQYISGQYAGQAGQYPSATKAHNQQQQQHYQTGPGHLYDAVGHNTTPTPRFDAPGKTSGGQAGYLNPPGTAGGSGGDGQATIDMGHQATASPEGTTGAVHVARISSVVSPGPGKGRASANPAGAKHQPAGVAMRQTDSGSGLQLPPLQNQNQGRFSAPGHMEGGGGMLHGGRLSQLVGEGVTREGLTMSDQGSLFKPVFGSGPAGVGSASTISAPAAGAGAEGPRSGLGTNNSWPGTQPGGPGLLGVAPKLEPQTLMPGIQPQLSHVSPQHAQQQPPPQAPAGLEGLPYMPGAHALNVRPPGHAIQHGGISGDLGAAQELWGAPEPRLPGDTPHPLEVLSPPSTRALIENDVQSLNPAEPGASLPFATALLPTNNGTAGHQGTPAMQQQSGGNIPAHQHQHVSPAPGVQALQQAGGQMMIVQGNQSAPAHPAVSRMVNVDNGPYSAGYASGSSYAPPSVGMVHSAPVYAPEGGQIDDWEFNDGQQQYYTWQPTAHQQMVSELLASHSLTQLAALRLLRSSRVQQLLSDTVTHPAAMENRGSAHHTLRVGPSVEAALEECRGLCVLMCACAAPPTLAEGGTTAPARLGKAAAGSWDAQQICQACLLVVSEGSAHPFARELAVILLGRMAYLHRLLPASVLDGEAVLSALGTAMSSEEPLGLRFAALCFAACASELAMEHLDMGFTAVLHDVRQAASNQPGGAAALVVYPSSGGTSLALLNMGVQVNASARLLFRTWPTLKALATEAPWAVPYQLMEQLPNTLHADILASLQRKHACQLQWATHTEVAGRHTAPPGSAWRQPGSTSGIAQLRSSSRHLSQWNATHQHVPALAAAAGPVDPAKPGWREETPELLLPGGGLDSMGMSDPHRSVTPSGIAAHGSAPAGLPGLIGTEGITGEDATEMVPEPLPLAHGMLGAGNGPDLGADADEALVITAPGSHVNVMNSPRLLVMRHPSLGQGPSPARHPFALDAHHGGTSTAELLLLAGSPRHLVAMSPRQMQISRIYPSLTPTKGQQVTPTRALSHQQASTQHPFALRGGMRGPSTSPLASVPPSASIAPFNNSLHIQPGQSAQVAPGAASQQQQVSPRGSNAHPQARSLRDLVQRPKAQAGPLPGSGQLQQGEHNNLLPTGEQQTPALGNGHSGRQSSLDLMQQRQHSQQPDSQAQAAAIGQPQGRVGSPWSAGALKRNTPDTGMDSVPLVVTNALNNTRLSSPPYHHQQGRELQQQQQQQGGRTSPNKLPRTTSQNCAVHMGAPGSGAQLRQPPPQHQALLQPPQQQGQHFPYPWQQPAQQHLPNQAPQPAPTLTTSHQLPASAFAQPGQQLMVMTSQGLDSKNAGPGAWLPPHVASAAAEMAVFTSQWDAQPLVGQGQGQLGGVGGQGYPIQGLAQHQHQQFPQSAGLPLRLPSDPQQMQMLYQQQVTQAMAGQGLPGFAAARQNSNGGNALL